MNEDILHLMKNSDECDDVAEFNETIGEPDSFESDEPRMKGKEGKPGKLGETDYCAWGALGNEQFVAVGKSQPQLPCGIYRVAVNDRGQLVFMKQRVITDNLFKMADSVSLRVLESIENFWSSKERFELFGMIFKRGIMLYGPPGSGKTVTVTLLAQQVIDKGGIVIMCDRPDSTSSALQQVRRVEPDRPIVNIIEDIDTVIENWGEAAILPMLDGENQINNVVHVATTNYPERLDPRIVNRPSRFDEIRKVDMPPANIRREYILNVLGTRAGVSESQLEQWVADTDGMSIAHLRELVVAVFCLQRDYEGTIARLKTMKKTKPKSGVKGNGAGFATKQTDYDEESGDNY